MAASEVGARNSSNQGVTEIYDLERKIKERLNWSRQEWIERGEGESNLKKITNSIKYWSTKLTKAQGDSNMYIGLYNENRNVTLSLTEVIDSLDELELGSKLRGFNTCRNPRYMNFAFDSKETKLIVKNKLRKIGESTVIYLEWAQESVYTVVKVHWVPLDLPVDNIINYLENFVKIKKYVREERKLLDGRALYNGTITFTTELNSLVAAKDIPHLCDVDGVELLINITGRKILCLNCEQLGHKASECNLPYCTVCRKSQPRSHSCVDKKSEKLTYAQVTQGKEHIHTQDSVNVEIKEDTITLSKDDLKKKAEAVSFWRSQPQADGSGKEKDEEKIEVGGSGFGDKNTWAASMQHEDVSSDSEELQSEPEEQNINYMKEYFDELQSLKVPELINQSGQVSVVRKNDTDTDSSIDNTFMEVQSAAVKRKLMMLEKKKKKKLEQEREEKEENKKSCLVVSEAQNCSSRRTYSRRGGGGLRPSTNNFESVNIFQTVADELKETECKK